MKIGGLMLNNGLTLYRITQAEDKPGVAGSILKFYAQRNINLEYLTESSTDGGFFVIQLCIESRYVDEVETYMKENPGNIRGLNIKRIDDVSTFAIYGPHFREKPGIAARFCSYIGNAGVNIYGISSSVSSVCCIIKSADVEKAREAVLSYFELP
ncbi:MAG TPA: ACT domain-containing protein [Caldithrix abyssi]|uniref:aspartate kinase n=1 Tax=Caldithrix abyssi TaxID=187145 RepID=A0A7V5VE96_CALAY|nr:ACT domain-containing protein [Caldithrix abyssi]